MLNIVKYERRIFDVDGVEVTDENMHEVAKWCGGDVVAAETPNDQSFVRVPVIKPLNGRQTKAFPGDKVLFAGNSFKVYTEKAFDRSFIKKDPTSANAPIEHLHVEHAVDQNVFEDPKSDISPGGSTPPSFPTFGGPPQNPGGSNG